MEDSLRCVIFDMDGCLVNSERVYINGWIHAFASYGMELPYAAAESWAGHGITWINEQVDGYTHDRERTLKLREIREAYFYEKLHQGEVALMPYALELLDFIDQAGLKKGIATCTLAEKGNKILKAHQLLERFDFVVFGDEVEHFKPAPDLYRKAIEKSGCMPQECLVFEDSVSGVTAAHNAGLTVIFIPDLKLNREAKQVPFDAKIETFRQGIEILTRKIR